MLNWFYRLTLKNVFLFDAIGAMISAMVLLFLVHTFQPVFGIPANTILLLAAIAGVYFLYSMSGYLFLYKKGVGFLKGIAVLNGLYAVFILALLLLEYNQLTMLGTLYMLGDAAIVGTMAMLEWSYTKREML